MTGSIPQPPSPEWERLSKGLDLLTAALAELRAEQDMAPEPYEVGLAKWESAITAYSTRNRPRRSDARSDGRHGGDADA